MEWSPQQTQALAAIDNWLRGPDQVFYLAGYAGTGKTTLAQEIARKVKGTVLACAYTGKAAQVLRRKGLSMASTIHGLIYTPIDQSRSKLRDLENQLGILLGVKEISKEVQKQTDELQRKIKIEQDNLERPAFALDSDSPIREAKLTIIDECSMVDEYIGNDLMSFGTKLLVLGDPGQLPPIHGAGFFTDQHPDLLLTEIHRQALGNPIINMATRVRKGFELNLGEYGESKVVRRSTIDFKQLFKDVDQILVGMHVTRRKINTLMRQMAGRNNQLPVKGDKLVCLRNDHDIGILNGSLWYVLESKLDEDPDISHLVIRSDDEEKTIMVQAHNAIFLGQELKWFDRIDGVQDFDYGYALTVHKSQGSQWKHVALYDEWRFKARKEWLYTALTRAEETITVLR